MMISVIGTPDSGKSKKAEDIICRLAGDERKYYIATMIPYGDDGEKRVKKHRDMRAGKGFITIEQPMDVHLALDEIPNPEGANVLLECMANLAANEMFGRNESPQAETSSGSVRTDNGENVSFIGHMSPDEGQTNHVANSTVGAVCADNDENMSPDEGQANHVEISRAGAVDTDSAGMPPGGEQTNHVASSLAGAVDTDSAGMPPGGEQANHVANSLAGAVDTDSAGMPPGREQTNHMEISLAEAVHTDNAGTMSDDSVQTDNAGVTPACGGQTKTKDTELEIIQNKIIGDVKMIRAAVKNLVVVSNRFDVQSGFDEETTRYAELMSEMNEKLVSLSDQSVMI